MSDTRRDVELVIPTIPEMELTASNTAEAIGKFMDLDADSIDEIKLALIEACINAIEHSQSQDSRVAISFDIGDTSLTITIRDHGQGFDLSQARQKLAQRRAAGDQRRGWGLKIMEELMDEVRLEAVTAARPSRW